MTPSSRRSPRRALLHTAMVLPILTVATLGLATRPSLAAAKIRVHLGVPYETVDGQTVGMDVYVPPRPGAYRGPRDVRRRHHRGITGRPVRARQLRRESGRGGLSLGSVGP